MCIIFTKDFGRASLSQYYILTRLKLRDTRRVLLIRHHVSPANIVIIISRSASYHVHLVFLVSEEIEENILEEQKRSQTLLVKHETCESQAFQEQGNDQESGLMMRQSIKKLISFCERDPCKVKRNEEEVS